MKTFETFIESEAFFPVLILLLVMLVCVFMWIVLSNKKEAQKRRDRKKVKIDENAEIKIVSDGYNNSIKPKKSKKEKIEEEPERTEIAIVEEVPGNNFLNIKHEPEDEVIYNIELPNFNEARFTREEEIDFSKIDYGDLSVPPVPDIFKDEFDDNKDDSIEKEDQIETSTYENLAKEKEVDNTTVDELVEEKREELSAFNQEVSEDREIHDEIKAETNVELKVENEPVEKVEDKFEIENTEVLDFPDFNQDDIFSSGDIETEIITAAEDYIKDIMGNK